jgi:hypothetical protein
VERRGRGLHLPLVIFLDAAGAGQEVVVAHGPQLMAPTHAYHVGWLKRTNEDVVSDSACEAGGATRHAATRGRGPTQGVVAWERASREARQQLVEAMDSLDHILGVEACSTMGGTGKSCPRGTTTPPAKACSC